MTFTELRAWVYSRGQLEQALGCDDIKMIYTPLKLAGYAVGSAERVILTPPEFLADCEDDVRRELAGLREKGFTRALAHTAGHIELLRSSGFTIHGGNRLNCTNSETVRFFADCGLADIIVSPELTVKRINKLDKPIKTGFLAYGKLPLMLNRRCPISDGKPCGKPRCGRQLTDRKGNKLDVLCSENTVEILNSDVLVLSDRLADFRTDFAVLRFTTEDDILPTVRAYAANRDIDIPNITRGLYYRGVL